ncbi:unnamed protein product [Brachionus calyciflorus]|uniref:Uncharacterized protein n=1 Tax=Brachionus calyciflorus TaxID=104777 RepID=A0A813SLL4_9BILA|nr:unnamed protein product [Brachionus calyciflorus]
MVENQSSVKQQGIGTSYPGNVAQAYSHQINRFEPMVENQSSVQQHGIGIPGRYNDNVLNRLERIEQAVNWNPAIVVQDHDHESNPELYDKYLCLNEGKRLAKETSDNPRTIIYKIQKSVSSDSAIKLTRPNAMTQIINRARNAFIGSGNFIPRSDIEIPEGLKKTIDSGTLFLWDDSGPSDPNRIIIFSTEHNIDLMNDSIVLYVDGTFKVARSVFKQVITINVNYRGLPVKGSTSLRELPSFPRELWNLHGQTLSGIPRTNNSLESWHKQFAQSICDLSDVNDLVKKFREEQHSMENSYKQLRSGDSYSRKKSEQSKDELLIKIIQSYSDMYSLKTLDDISEISRNKN